MTKPRKAGYLWSFLAGVAGAMIAFGGAHSETPTEWVTLGARVHRAVGSFLPVGMRIESNVYSLVVLHDGRSARRTMRWPR
jgi:hypothetical protein